MKNLVYEKNTTKNIGETIKDLKVNLKTQKFGVLWEFNFKDKLSESDLILDEEYIIFEVCNPKMAKALLDKNIHMGYMLPCKMVVRTEGDKTHVGLANPITLYGIIEENIDNEDIINVFESLKKAIDMTI